MKPLALALLCLCSLSACPWAQSTLKVEPQSAALGEPFTLTLEVDDPLALDPGTPELDDSWLLLDSKITPTSQGMRFVWTLASLESGKRELHLVPGKDLSQVAQGVHVNVESVLRADESEPRAARVLPDNFGESYRPAAVRRSWRLLAGVLGAAFLVLAVAFRLWRRRRQGRQMVGLPGLLERFDRLAASEADPVARAHRWAALLREAVDAREPGENAKAWAARTEEQWLESVRVQARLDAQLFARIEQTLSLCTRIRFGGESPSTFAREDLQLEVRSLLEALDGRVQDEAPNAGRAA